LRRPLVSFRRRCASRGDAQMPQNATVFIPAPTRTGARPTLRQPFRGTTCAYARICRHGSPRRPATARPRDAICQNRPNRISGNAQVPSLANYGATEWIRVLIFYSQFIIDDKR